MDLWLLSYLKVSFAYKPRLGGEEKSNRIKGQFVKIS